MRLRDRGVFEDDERSDRDRGEQESERVNGGSSDVLHQTDHGNTQRLVQSYGKDLRYSHELSHWFIWRAGRFEWDETGGIETYAKRTVAQMLIDAAGGNA